MPTSQISDLLMMYVSFPPIQEDLWTFTGTPSLRRCHDSQLSGCMQRREAVVGMAAMPEKVKGGKEEGQSQGETWIERDTA